MAILPRFLATTPPPRGAGMARATDIGALTRTGDIEVWRGVSQLGRGVQDVGRTLFAINQEKQALDDNLQTAKRTASAKKEAQGLWNAIKKMEVPTDEMGTTISQDATTTFQDAITEQMKDASPRVKYNLEIYAAEAVPAFARETKKLTESIWKEYHLVEEEKLITALVAEGRYEEAEARIDKLDTSNLITHETAVTMKRDLIEQQKLLLAINLAGTTLLPEHIKAASNAIEKSKEFATEAERAPFRNQLKSVLNNARRAAKEQADALAGEANKQLTDLMGKNQVTTQEVEARREVLDDTDYKNWMKIAIAPTDKKGNPVEVGDLYGDALDIWRGTISKPNFDKRLRESLARFDGINQNEYRSLMQTAEQTLKSSQAEALKRADTEAGRLIVDLRDDEKGLQALLAVLSGQERQDFMNKRELQFWFLSQYNKAMRDWIAENPDKTGKEFYQYSEEQKHVYWNTSEEEIKARLPLLEDRMGPFESAEDLRAKARATTDIEERKRIYEQGKKLGYWE